MMNTRTLLLPAYATLCVALLFINGCGKADAPSVTPGSSVSFTFRGEPSRSLTPTLTYDLTDEQAAMLVALVNSPPTAVHGKGSFEFLDAAPPHAFKINDAYYQLHDGHISFKDRESLYEWAHPFFSEIGGRDNLSGQDELAEIFDTMTDYDWPE